jgi:hypothetical protein
MALLLPVLAMMAAFSINTAHMQLTRTELKVATDAAAKAAGRTFSETQAVDAAKTAARVTAALNTVAGSPLLIREEDAFNEIEFGRSIQPYGVSTRYQFEKIPTTDVASGDVVASAIRINGLRNSDGISGRVPLLIPGILGSDDFSTIQNSVAMQVDRDISLVLDRSGSMDEISFAWPTGVSPWTTEAKDAGVAAGIMTVYRGRYYFTTGNDSISYQQWAWEHYYDLGPAPQAPWESVLAAVDAFIDVLNRTSQEEQISLASYADTGRLDTWLEKNHDHLSTTVHNMSTGGNTAIGQGMQEGIQALLHASARPYAAKTMVVMTDGMHNTGIDPVVVAQDFMSQYQLTIHTVTFGAAADRNRMEQVAAIGGGRAYHAEDGTALVSIFEEIANNLPTILTH